MTQMSVAKAMKLQLRLTEAANKVFEGVDLSPDIVLSRAYTQTFDEVMQLRADRLAAISAATGKAAKISKSMTYLRIRIAEANQRGGMSELMTFLAQLQKLNQTVIKPVKSQLLAGNRKPMSDDVIQRIVEKNGMPTGAQVESYDYRYAGLGNIPVVTDEFVTMFATLEKETNIAIVDGTEKLAELNHSVTVDIAEGVLEEIEALL